MTVVEKLKAESMRLRKERNSIAPSIQFALSEIEKVGKNAGNRVTTDDEAIRVVQKLIATIDENIRVTLDDTRRVAFEQERAVLNSALPQMVNEADVRKFLATLGTPANKGVVMKALKEKYGALVDMKQAGAVATEMFNV
jgi:uncharacterized protein YqeY